MTDSEIIKLVDQLEATKVLEEEEAWLKLKPLGKDVVPHLANGFKRMKKASGRRSCVFHSMRYARVCEAAFQLGIIALQDRSALVRYRACGLLAYSLRDEAIPYLRKLLSHNNPKTVNDAKAAIDAIENKNHHFFHDRNHTGQVHWVLNEEDNEGIV